MATHRIRLAFIATLFVAGNCAAFEYKGVPLGAREEAFVKAHPDFVCMPSGNDLSERVCRLDGGTYAGVPVKGTTAYFVGNRLFQVIVLFEARHFLAVRDVLTEAYGPPTSVESPPLPSSAGRRGDNHVFGWDKGLQHIRADFYALGSTSSVTVRSDAYLEDLRRLKTERGKRGTGDI